MKRPSFATPMVEEPTSCGPHLLDVLGAFAGGARFRKARLQAKRFSSIGWS